MRRVLVAGTVYVKVKMQADGATVTDSRSILVRAIAVAPNCNDAALH